MFYYVARKFPNKDLGTISLPFGHGGSFKGTLLSIALFVQTIQLIKQVFIESIRLF